MMMLFTGGWQQGKLGGGGGVGGMQHGGGQLQPAIAEVAIPAPSAKATAPLITARIELMFAFMAVSVLQVRLGASKKGAAPIARCPVLRRSQLGPNLPCKPHAVKHDREGQAFDVPFKYGTIDRLLA
jgi:hypothetical protein